MAEFLISVLFYEGQKMLNSISSLLISYKFVTCNILSIRANPKSHSLTTPAAVNSMFSGFMSLCIHPCLWQYATAWRVCHTICWVNSSGHPLGYLSSSFSTVLSQYSNTRWSLRFLLNTSRRLTKFGCFKFWKWWWH